MKNAHRLFTIALFLTAGAVASQPPGGGGPGNGNPPDHAAPIGGIELLLLAGAALGVKKLTNKKTD